MGDFNLKVMLNYVFLFREMEQNMLKASQYTDKNSLALKISTVNVPKTCKFCNVHLNINILTVNKLLLFV